ncbi:MAG: tetratricopeptide repeat protein [Dehalococcoidia bacterium]
MVDPNAAQTNVYLAGKRLRRSQPLRNGDVLAIRCTPELLVLDAVNAVDDELRIDPDTMDVWLGAKPVLLTGQLANALALLHRQRNLVVPKAELYTHLHPQDPRLELDRTEGNLIESLIRRLRQQLEPNPQHPRFLLNAYNRGYILVIGEGSGPAIRGRIPNELPHPLTSFVGRAYERREVARLVRERRVVLIYGPPGVGKTRLALQVASDVLTGFPDGVWLVDLSRATDPAQVAPLVAATVHAREVPGRSAIDRLQAALTERRMLIVLDNAEHVVDEAVHLIRSIAFRCPTVTFLVTSRVALGLPGEARFPLQPLTVPSEQASWMETPSPADLARLSEAIQLFVDRARDHRNNFALTDGNVQAVARICRRLDGIPLAIELAVSHLGSVATADALDAQLTDPLHLLGDGSTDIARHGTMRAALDWSFDRLPEPARVLLARLTIFAGGAPLVAVEPVCAGGVLDAVAIRASLDTLVDHGLVVTDAAGEEARVRLLEVIRAYAREKLNERPSEAATLAALHRDAFLALLRERTLGIVARDQQQHREWLNQEQDNLRAALAYSDRMGDTSELLEMAGLLTAFWIERGYLTEGREWLNRARRAAADAPPALVAKALEGAGAIASRQGDNVAAWAILSECLALREALGDMTGAATAHNELGIVASARRGFDEAEEHFEAALRLWQIDDLRNIAASRNGLGMVAYRRGHLQVAIDHHECSLEIRRMIGDPHLIAVALNNLGLAAQDAGDLKRAAGAHAEALEIRQAAGDPQGVATSATNLGDIALVEGDELRRLVDGDGARAKYTEAFQHHQRAAALAGRVGDRALRAIALGNLGVVEGRFGNRIAAMRLLHESLVIRHALNDPAGVASVFECIADLELEDADTGRATRLLAAATRIRRTIDASPSVHRRQQIERNLTELDRRMSRTELDDAWRAGEDMTEDSAIAYAVRALLD